MSRPRAFVLGRFPPPVDGQTQATAFCADALAPAFEAVRLDTEPGGPAPVTAHPRLRPDRALHYVRLRSRLARALAAEPTAPVLWHAVSPAPLGHLRDVAATLPAFAPAQPVAAVFHRATFEALFGHPLWRHTAARLVSRLSLAVVQSPRLGEALAPYVPAERVRVIPNPVQAALVATVAELDARRARPPGRPLSLLFLSHMHPEKGVADVIAAATILHARGVAFSLDLVGRWPDDAARAAAEAALAEGGIADRTRIHGGVSDPQDVRRLHLAADVFLLPTYHPTETQPIAILEALSAGTPVVTVDRGVTADLIGAGGAGLLVPARAPAAIADAVVRLAEASTWQAASVAARGRFDAHFSPAVVAEAWRVLTAELAAMPGPAAGPHPRRRV